MPRSQLFNKDKLTGLKIAIIGVLSVFLGAVIIVIGFQIFGRVLIYTSFPIVFYGLFISFLEMLKKKE